MAKNTVTRPDVFFPNLIPAVKQYFFVAVTLLRMSRVQESGRNGIINFSENILFDRDWTPRCMVDALEQVTTLLRQQKILAECRIVGRNSITYEFPKVKPVAYQSHLFSDTVMADLTEIARFAAFDSDPHQETSFLFRGVAL